MRDNLLILGSGQYGTVVKEMVLQTAMFDRISFLDDSYLRESERKPEVIGSFQDLEKFRNQFRYAIPAIGNPEIRMRLFRQAEQLGYEIPVIVSPAAWVSPSATLQPGVVVEPLAGVHTRAQIEKGSYISMGAVVNHNAVVEEGCHIDNNAVVMSGVRVRAYTTTEPNAVIHRA